MQIDRLFPIGPYVQPTLLENWVSAAFELFGGDPIVYLAAKKAMVLALLMLGMLAWGRLGQELGFVPVTTAKEEGEREEARVLRLALEEAGWMEVGCLEELATRPGKSAGPFLSPPHPPNRS